MAYTLPMPREPHGRSASQEAVPWGAWACLGAVAVFFLSLSIQKIWTNDFWWQLRTGEWILRHGAVPSVDTLSYTAAGQPWVEMRWLFCLLAYALWQTGGAALVILTQTAMLAAAWLIIMWPLRRTAMTLPGLLVLVLGVATAAHRFVFRPELISFLGIATFLAVIPRFSGPGAGDPSGGSGRDAAAGRTPPGLPFRFPARRAVWLLPVLQIVWTNAHTTFILGPILAWLFAGGDVVRRLVGRLTGAPVRDRGPLPGGLLNPGLCLAAAAITIACFVNPYGLQGVAFPFTLFREIQKDSVLGDAIGEFRSPLSIEHWAWNLHIAVVFLFVTAATFYLNRRRFDPARFIIWGAFVYLAGVSVRNVALMGLVATWACLVNLDEALVKDTVAAARPSRPIRGTPGLHAAAAILLLGASWYVVTDRFYVRMGAPRRFGFGVVEWSMPARAAEFILAEGVQPELFHSLGDGSYFAWAAKDRYKVFVDGRLEVYGEDFFRRFFDMLGNDWERVSETGGVAAFRGYIDQKARDWERFADARGINTAVLERQNFGWFVASVLSSPRWALVYMDARDLVFVRDIPAHAEVIRKHRIDPGRPWAPPGPEPAEIPSGWRRAVGSVEAPWYSLSMARNFLAIGSMQNAERFLVRGLERFPGDPEMTKLLGQVRQFSDRGAGRGSDTGGAKTRSDTGGDDDERSGAPH